MDNLQDNLQYIKSKLEKYGADIYDYCGTKFVGIKNPFSDNNLVITLKKEENVMEFTFQSARFPASDLDGIILHAEKFLTDKLVAAEFFLNGRSIFGGSRQSEGSDFKNIDEMLDWYTGGNEKIAENLRGFFKNDGITLEIFCWSGKKDRKIKILPDGKIEDIA